MCVLSSAPWLRHLRALALGAVIVVPHAASAQEPAGDAPDTVPDTVPANPGLEEADPDGRPVGWRFVARPEGQGQTVALDDENPREGSFSALLDTTSGRNQFTNLMQSFDASEHRGKMARFRAAVRTADLNASTRVQLWFRIDRESPEGETLQGAFDNMQDRPIRDADWTEHDVVLPVAEDASRLVFGMFVVGKGRAWIDDVSVEVVPDDTPSTAMMTEGSRPSISREVWEAAEKSPPQPFFNHWLWLALVTLVLFAMSQLGRDVTAAERPRTHFLVRGALRFSIVYWVLYSFPSPFAQVGLWLARPLYAVHGAVESTLVRWTAAGPLGIERELVTANGSGDTTYAYVQVLLCFVGAVVIGGLWTALDRRRGADRIPRDLLRVYLRYVLAFSLLSYGLAKLGTYGNQFPPVSAYTLDKTYGESSPMNLVWTFMGASRAYTTFAGLSEAIAGVLLLWRRTTLLGALCAFGVMSNVAMLNFCYDVPVKQYSAHLVVMALFLLLHDWKRLTRLFLCNRPTEAADLSFPFQGRRALAVRRVLKTVVLVIGVLGPVVGRVVLVAQNAPSAAEVAQRDEEHSEYLLTKRGFRWINEVPFNR